MSSPTVLVPVSILAAAIAYDGHQLRGEMIVPSQHGDVFGVFHVKMAACAIAKISGTQRQALSGAPRGRQNKHRRASRAT